MTVTSPTLVVRLNRRPLSITVLDRMPCFGGKASSVLEGKADRPIKQLIPTPFSGIQSCFKSNYCDVSSGWTSEKVGVVRGHRFTYWNLCTLYFTNSARAEPTAGPMSPCQSNDVTSVVTDGIIFITVVVLICLIVVFFCFILSSLFNICWHRCGSATIARHRCRHLHSVL